MQCEPSPALLNALNDIYKNWNYKPTAFVSYRGVSGGLRAVQLAKQTLTTLKMAPIVEAVTIQMVAQHVKAEQFSPTEIHQISARFMLKELHRWAQALKRLR